MNGLPLRVVMKYTRMYVPPNGAGAVQLGTGCFGDGTNATDLVLDIQGDGRTYGPGDDAIRIMNARPGASNLQIEGRANCGRKVGAAHQDGVQVLGGHERHLPQLPDRQLRRRPGHLPGSRRRLLLLG